MITSASPGQHSEPIQARRISQPSAHDKGADCCSRDQPREEKENKDTYFESERRGAGGGKSDKTRKPAGWQRTPAPQGAAETSPTHPTRMDPTMATTIPPKNAECSSGVYGIISRYDEVARAPFYHGTPAKKYMAVLNTHERPILARSLVGLQIACNRGTKGSISAAIAAKQFAANHLPLTLPPCVNPLRSQTTVAPLRTINTYNDPKRA